MTREQFETRAIKQLERKLGIPSGWWGTKSNFRSPRGTRVSKSGSLWSVIADGSVAFRGTHNQAVRRAKAYDLRQRKMEDLPRLNVTKGDVLVLPLGKRAKA